MATDDDALAALLREAARPWSDVDAPELTRFFDRYAGHRVVLLGEASHGTAEFYRARAAITRHLIREHGYNVVAIEADWPDAAALERHVRGRAPGSESASAFSRFPAWMWRNTEVADFVRWLGRHNAGLPPARQVRFHGLDIYSLGQSMAAVLAYLDGIDAEAARTARERYDCLAPWQADPAAYGRPSLSHRHEECETAVLAQLRELLEKRLDYAGQDGESFFDAAQNARLVASAERYYRAMYQGSTQSWNLRDTHMFETLEHVLRAHGGAAKAVVWAHNSHVGDASATEMGSREGQINLGQLCRERFGAAAALVGMGTHTGTVAAASHWEGAMHVKAVRPSLEGSHEAAMHRSGVPRFTLDLAGATDELRRRLDEPRLERFIGVIYRPETERPSHYAHARLARQFDAYVWIDETRAVTPLAASPEAWPFVC